MVKDAIHRLIIQLPRLSFSQYNISQWRSIQSKEPLRKLDLKGKQVRVDTNIELTHDKQNPFDRNKVKIW